MCAFDPCRQPVVAPLGLSVDRWRALLLDVDGHHKLEAYVAPHVVHAGASCGLVLVGIFQAAQVTLIGLVGQVAASDVDRGYPSALPQYVGACRGV